MHNLDNDKAIDHLSKKAAELYTAPVTPDWESMLHSLDKEMPVEKKKRRLLFWWFFFAGIITIGVLYFTTNGFVFSGKTNNQPHSSTKKPSSVIENSNAEKKQNSFNNTEKNTYQSNNYIKTKENSEINKNEIITTKSNAENLQTLTIKPLTYSRKKMAGQNTNRYQNNFVQQNKQSILDNKNEILQDQNKQEEVINSIASTSNQSSGNTNTTIIDVSNNNSLEANENKVLDSNNTVVSNIQKSNVEDSISKHNATTDTSNNKKSFTKNKFSIETLLSIDATTVRLKYVDRISLGGGLLVGYHFSPKWSLHTGAIFTRKNYKSAGSDFNPPKNSWLNNVQLQQVTGYCEMWDFPLLARMNIQSSKKNNWFISGGFSNYLMQQENYDYLYYNSVGILYSRNGQYKNSVFQPFRILHFSSGFQYPIGKKLSMQVEPYAKIPIKGVGYGNLALSSFGVNFSVQYRQLSKKK